MAYPIVDAHLDMGYNALRGRDLRLTAAEIREAEKRDSQSCMVTFPELRRGGVAVVFGSTFSSPTEFPESTDHPFDVGMAEKSRKQMDIYREWEDEGHARIIRSVEALDDHLKAWESDGVVGIVINMESAEPIETPDELGWWVERGVRMIGPAWGPTRYCGGFAGKRGQAVGFTDLGRELLAGMRDMHVGLDLAHSSTELFMEGLDAGLPVCCTHTVPRELTGVARFPDGAMMKQLAGLGGVVGIGLGNMFVAPEWGNLPEPRDPVPLSKVADVLELMARSAGWDHVGIGSDLDGGIGVEESPEGLDSAADLPKLADVLPPDHAAAVLGGNWINFLRKVLPAA